MKYILEYVAGYLASKLNMTLAEDVCIVKMPDEPTRCLCIYEDKSTQYIPPQVDAEVHYIRIRVRDKDFLSALGLSNLCAGYLQTDSPDYPDTRLADIDTTGIINLAEDFSVCSIVLCMPYVVQDDMNQRVERIVDFTCKLITKKLS